MSNLLGEGMAYGAFPGTGYPVLDVGNIYSVWSD